MRFVATSLARATANEATKTEPRSVGAYVASLSNTTSSVQRTIVVLSHTGESRVPRRLYPGLSVPFPGLHATFVCDATQAKDLARRGWRAAANPFEFG